MITKHQKTYAEQTIPEFAVHMILKYVGNISQCLAVRSDFVPVDYVTSVRVLSNFRKEQFYDLLMRKNTITSVEFYDSLPCGSFLKDMISLTKFNRIDKIVLTKCNNIILLPWLKDPDIIYSLEQYKWTINFNCHKKIDVEFHGCEKVINYLESQYPCDIITSVLGNMYYSPPWSNGTIMPFIDCDQSDFMKYRGIFVFLYEDGFVIKQTRTFENSKSAVVLETTGNRFFVALFTMKYSVWKMYIIYQHMGFSRQWISNFTWNDVKL